MGQVWKKTPIPRKKPTEIAINDLIKENAAKEAQITDLEEMSADLTEENMAQGEQITTLEEMVADLYEGSAE